MAETKAITNTRNNEITCAPQSGAPESAVQGWTYRPGVDIVDHAELVTLLVDLPGVSRESVSVECENGLLSIQGRVDGARASQSGWLRQEYGIGNFHRRFAIDSDIDVNGIDASLTNGVLTVTLPKATHARRRQIAVKG